jgi:hypothetical protein
VESGAIRGVEPVARIEWQEIDFSALRKLGGLIYYKPAIVTRALNGVALEEDPGAVPADPGDVE